VQINIVSAQNLVLNPSFETLRDTCWPYLSGISDSACLYWDCSSAGTPDYLNKCANSLLNGFMGVPINFGSPGGGGGFQYAKDGDAYAGYFHLAGISREYIQGRLSDSLQIGKKYTCYFYVVKENSSYDSINNFGVAFTTYRVQQYNNVVITNILPKINDTTLIGDTLNWIKIEGTFIADSAYRYFTIGNFFDEAHTKGTLSYFYVDDVHVELIKNDGVEDVGSSKLEVYPNPASQSLVISSKSLVNTIEVSNMLGQSCIIPPLQRGQGGLLILNIETLSSGIYFIKATDTNGNTMNGKFVKE
jgi:hypothetical protein